jgi:light-regulated signal transduction histidine kinase (bacteriophytochrome)
VSDLREFRNQYGTALRRHLAGADESTLQLAYELGRGALGAGVGTMEMAAVYREVLVEVLLRAGTPEEGVSAARRASEFFIESLPAFEAIERGFWETNARLRRTNEELGQTTTQLEVLNKELETFSYSVSHDLRAPLRAMDGFSQALLEDYGGKLDDQGRDYLGRVRAASQRMAQLIDDLLNLSRVSRTEMRRGEVDLSTLAREIVEELRKTEPSRQVEAAVAPGLTASGDARLLRVVLANLLGNAWKFTRKKPQARIEFGLADKDGGQAYFVRDEGAGFDMAYVGKLFGAFQRLHSAGEFEGTGIGLATVQRIIRRHGGKVWAEGAVGKGATFYFTLG